MEAYAQKFVISTLYDWATIFLVLVVFGMRIRTVIAKNCTARSASHTDQYSQNVRKKRYACPMCGGYNENFKHRALYVSMHDLWHHCCLLIVVNDDYVEDRITGQIKRDCSRLSPDLLTSL